jgi:outer membrane usher protein
MQKSLLIFEVKFAHILVIFVLVIFFVSTASADDLVPKALPKQESEYKSSDKKAQELFGQVDNSKPDPEKLEENKVSDVLTKKEEESQKFLKFENESNTTEIDIPIQNSSEQPQSEKVVPDEKREDKDNDLDDSNLQEQSTDSKLVPDEKNAVESTHELSKTTEEHGDQDESGLVVMGDGKKYLQSIVSLKVNYEELDILSTILKDQSNNLLVLADDMTAFEIKEEYLNSTIVNLNDKKYINLTALEGAKSNLNEGDLALDITIPAEQIKIQRFNTTIPPITEDIVGKPARGAFLNYDVVVSRNENTDYMTGLNDFNYFNDKGVLMNSFFIKKELSNSSFVKVKDKKKENTQLTRLETNWTFDNVNDMARWRFGDSLTKPADWSGSTRFVGLQYSTNFSVRPDLITHPLMNFQGRAALPTIFDVYANNLPIYHGESKTGDFEIANLPVITGKGDLFVKTQDITGAIRTISIPYYSSPSLLKAGLSDYSFETGIERKEFGLTSNKYDNFLTSANYRYGINDYLTSAVHFESLKNYASIGTTHDIQLGNYGLITTSVASNIHNINNSQKGSLGYSYQESRYNFGATISKSGKKYSDVYNILGHASSEPTYQTSAGYNHEKLGSIFVSFLSFVANDVNSESKHVKILATTYEKNLTKSSSFRFTVGGNMANKRKESFAYLSFNANLGTKSIALSNSNQNGVTTKQFEYTSPVGKKLGWGYRASFIKGLTPDYDLQLDRKGEKGDMSLYFYRYGGAPVQQLEFTGGVVTMDGGFYRTQPIYNSLVLVKVGGIKDVPVYSNNMLIGHTDKKGEMLVPDVLPYVPSEIRLDQNRLPLDTNFSSVSVKTAPKWRTGVMIDFEINTVRSAELVLLDNHKNALNLDKVVAIEGIKEALFVGYNGKLYITDINNLTDLKGKACGQGECCSFEVPVNIDSKDPILDLGEVICY